MIDPQEMQHRGVEVVAVSLALCRLVLAARLYESLERWQELRPPPDGCWNSHSRMPRSTRSARSSWSGSSRRSLAASKPSPIALFHGHPASEHSDSSDSRNAVSRGPKHGTSSSSSGQPVFVSPSSIAGARAHRAASETTASWNTYFLPVDRVGMCMAPTRKGSAGESTRTDSQRLDSSGSSFV